ncbi:MAG: hypothetical protein Q4E39_01195 [bacterium]|nr:hypothetical protein [bacterium]
MADNKVVFDYEKIKKAINSLYIAYNKSGQMEGASGWEYLDVGWTNAEFAYLNRIDNYTNEFRNHYGCMCGDVRVALEYMLDDMKDVLATMQNWDETSNDIKDTSKDNYTNRASSNNSKSNDVAKKEEESTSIWDDLEHL